MLFPMNKHEEELHAAGEALYQLSAAIVRGSSIPRQMSLTSASTLAAVSRLGPQRITELAALQNITQPSMTVVISGLEQAGFVERAPDPTDGRAVLVSATAVGEEYLATRRRAMAGRIAALARQLPDEDVAALTAAVPALLRLRALQERSTQAGESGTTSSAPKAKR
jgi:DNA-binding MarR family transcriptional regulator